MDSETPDFAGDSANDEGGHDDTLRPMEALDSDEVRNDGGDEVVDPPEHWSEADKYGMTPREEREGEPLDEKLAAEEPDPSADRLLPQDEADRLLPQDEADRLLPEDDVDRLAPEDHGTDEGQVSGTPEDGDSVFPVVE